MTIQLRKAKYIADALIDHARVSHGFLGRRGKTNVYTTRPISKTTRISLYITLIDTSIEGNPRTESYLRPTLSYFDDEVIKIARCHLTSELSTREVERIGLLGTSIFRMLGDTKTDGIRLNALVDEGSVAKQSIAVFDEAYRYLMECCASREEILMRACSSIEADKLFEPLAGISWMTRIGLGVTLKKNQLVRKMLDDYAQVAKSDPRNSVGFVEATRFCDCIRNRYLT